MDTPYRCPATETFGTLPDLDRHTSGPYHPPKPSTKGRRQRRLKNSFRDPREYLNCSQVVFPTKRLARKAPDYTWDPERDEENPVCVLRSVMVGLFMRKDPGKFKNRKAHWFTDPNENRELVESVVQAARVVGLPESGALNADHLDRLGYWLEHTHHAQLIVYDRMRNDEIFYSSQIQRPAKDKIPIVVAGSHSRLILSRKTYLQERSICDMCSTVYRRKHNCQKSNSSDRYPSTIMPTPYHCPGIGCNAIFGTWYNLDRHMSGYHPPGSLPTASKSEVKKNILSRLNSKSLSAEMELVRYVLYGLYHALAGRTGSEIAKTPDPVRVQQRTGWISQTAIRAIQIRKAYLHQRHMDNMSINRPRILDRYF